ncbi:MAG: HAD-IIIC family phosphatase [Bryobacteraceae bacterium]
MWQTDWAERTHLAPETGAMEPSQLDPQSVESVYFLHWKEHCLECAQPDCYRVCPLYVQRRDRRCARFQNGILPNPRYTGLYPFGAEIRFRRWGVLESSFGCGAAAPKVARRLDRVDRFLLGCITPVSSWLRRVSPNYRLNRAYGVLREFLINRMTRHGARHWDEFVMEVWNLQSAPVRLVIECQQDGPRFRSSVVAAPGRTMHRIPAGSMNIDLYGSPGVIRVYPENDAEAHVVFTWLDFVNHSEARRNAGSPAAAPVSAKAAKSATTVKCVVWDLDNTLWEGILGEQNPDQVTLRPGVRETMLGLDARGILQSVTSKNDHQDAWGVLQRLGLDHLLLHPRINWRPKSENIRDIVGELNIGADACAFVDDSPFERSEVSSRIPEIRVFAETEISGLLDRPEFTVEVTEESRQRRQYYVAETGRKQLAQGYGGDYGAFLRTCGMEARLYSPSEPAHATRALELLNRTNQLNLTAHRYQREEFERLLRDPAALCVCTSCRDRFGDYGMVGFASLKPSGDRLLLVDFVLSCRVAQKKVENAWFGWLAGYARAAGYRKVHARYLKTARNHVLLDALREAGFTEAEKYDDGLLLELDASATPPMSDLVSVEARGVAGNPVLVGS